MKLYFQGHAERYAVDYDAFASNLIPEIRVVEIGGTNS